ncbi:MAG: phosphoadenosine phosphosulfate reductase family protein [Anaerolineae bacterium]|nr:phosphoadenosine phosphosulfate reductase family protein [Anaerolineae bacterium]MDW8172084.1 phosphoadenosine phosphosulfate reductase family protein [Anaerolineae bacterium]
MIDAIYWCDYCHTVFKASTPSERKSHPCIHCGTESYYLSTDVRPVFARERRILQFYGHGPLLTEQVWRSSKSPNYFIDGRSVHLPSSAQLKDDLAAIGDYIADSDHYDAVDQRLLEDYRQALEINRPYLNSLEDESFRFVQSCVKRFPRRTIMVSFSGGKDSTVVSDIVRRALGRSDILHVFGDTTLEDPNTYQYVRDFREQNPLVPFFEARAEHDFHQLVDEIGPPSRVMRWCCTIFKAGPINNLLQSMGDQKVLTFYGIRRDESTARSRYHRIASNEEDRLGVVVKVDQNDELNGVTVGAKIGQQITGSPIIDWTEFDVWLYIILNQVMFNKSYRLGYTRVGCWLCPLNSDWSELIGSIFFSEDTARWRKQLIEFATKIGKPDPEEYVDDRAWVKRFGGAGMPNGFSGLEVKPCGDMDNTVQIDVNRPVNVELEEFLKPLGTINRDKSRPALGEIYLEGRQGQKWSAIIVQAPEGSTTLRFTVINPEGDFNHISAYLKYQASKFQTCIQCTACSAVCPYGAITIKPDARIYEIDQNVCIGCMECVTHFGTTGCLVAKSLGVSGNSAPAKLETSSAGFIPLDSLF